MKAFIIEKLLVCIGAIPRNIRSPIGRYLGNLIYFVPTRERAIALKQIRLMLPESNAARITRRMYGSLGQTAIESFNIKPYVEHAAEHLSIDKPELAHDLLHAGRPVIALTAHTGNWDLMAAYIVQLGGNLTTVGKPARSAALQTILARLREEYGIRMLWRTGRDGTRDVIKEIKENRVVAALIDQDTRVSSVWTPFFGIPAKCPSGIVALAKKYDAEIVTCFNFRTGGNTYKLFVDHLDKSLSIEEVLMFYNRRLEELIRQFPEQWVWVHKRWRSPDPEFTMSSREYLRFLEQKLEQAI